MYILRTEGHFDSAHFLANYDGKCSNIHGHRWIVDVEVQSDSLNKDGQLEGMVVDFGDLKKDVNDMLDEYDHSFIYQVGSLKESTIKSFNEEGFSIISIDFRPTAENFSKLFYDKLKDKGYNVRKVTVYETPKNYASYME